MREFRNAEVQARRHSSPRRQATPTHVDAVRRYLAGVAYQTSRDRSTGRDEIGRQRREGVPAQPETAATPRTRVRLPRAVARDWALLAAPSPMVTPFDPAMVAHLPEPARRWLNHAIAPGTPLRRSAELEMHGEVRLGSWRRFEARQVLAPPEGFVWAVTTHLAGLPMHGYDRYTRGTGQMCHKLFGVVPVVSATGPDLTRSAAGRLASEIVFVPAAAAAADVAWRSVDERDVVALLSCGGWTHEVTLTVGPSGALEKVTVPRWARVGRGPYREHLFAAVVDDEATFGGYTIPSRITAGWGYRTGQWAEGAFIRQTIDHVTFH
ncbi:MAG: hypothetical protein IRZ05_10710 [Micromonosporaceae bacterium]|nr:hypothetical protein [Micromonosporaceae bacterium]